MERDTERGASLPCIEASLRFEESKRKNSSHFPSTRSHPLQLMATRHKRPATRPSHPPKAQRVHIAPVAPPGRPKRSAAPKMRGCHGEFPAREDVDARVTLPSADARWRARRC